VPCRWMREGGGPRPEAERAYLWRKKKINDHEGLCGGGTISQEVRRSHPPGQSRAHAEQKQHHRSEGRENNAEKKKKSKLALFLRREGGREDS